MGKYFLTILAATLFGSCTNQPLHVRLVESDTAKLMIVDEEEVNATRDLLMSDIAEGFRIVRFENREEAYFKPDRISFSDNYIAAGGNPVKLFTRDGKYICDIGAVGNGPGEYYVGAYDILIDEPSDRIYVAGFSKNINSYDLYGNFTGVVNFPHPLNKGKMFKNPDGTLSAIQLCFKDKENDDQFVAATFGPNMKEGDTIRYVFAPQLATNFIDDEGYAVGFNNEVWSYRCTERPTFHTTFNDTLYYYNTGADRLDAIFTLNMDPERKSGGYFVYQELPRFILANIVGGNHKGSIIVDKSTLEAWRLGKKVNDFFFDLPWGFSVKDGHTYGLYEPSELQTFLEEALEKGEIEDKYRKEVDELMSTLHENDNNVMIIARLKQDSGQ